GWSDRADALVHPGSVGPDELDARARSGAQRGVLRHVNGAGRTTGLPQLRIDSLLELTGVGERLSGVHYLTAVRHTLTKDGYFTEFQVGLPEPVLPRAGGGERPATGPLVTATVDDIDDPNGWGRVRVLLPWLDGEIASVWARLAVPAAGGERGFFFIPEVGDEVIVGFLGGEARFPVVLGSTWNGTQAPPESLDAATNPIRSIVSRTGHRLTLDDTDGAAQVKVETAAGQSLLLDDTSGGEKIELADKTGNKITMSSSGIALEAAAGGNVEVKASSGKVALQGTQLEGSSTGPAKISSSAALDLQASATLGITGALVKINS
nr:phage baseplate assembly protein V [Actinomycetota bacterium]